MRTYFGYSRNDVQFVLAGAKSKWRARFILASRRVTFGGVAYVGGLLAFTAYVADTYLDLRPFRRRLYEVADPPLLFAICSRARASDDEAGQGCVDWPGGRVLLQQALHDGLHDPGSRVLEIGAGVGTASIGLALAQRRRRGGGSSSVIASDVCDHALGVLRANAEVNGLGDGCRQDGGGGLRIASWDAAGGAAAVARLPVPADSLTHVIGADLVSSPVYSDGGAAGGLEATLASLLEAKPDLRVTLLLVDRRGGAAVGALAAAAGQQPSGAVGDPSIAGFERECARLGLRVERRPLPQRVVDGVVASQGLGERLRWFLGLTWESLVLYDVKAGGREEGHAAPFSSRGR